MGQSFALHYNVDNKTRSSMRTIAITSVALAAGASAQFRELAGGIMERYFFGYGCYCNFDGDFNNLPGSGRGKPVDAWDAACKALVDGYECAAMEFDGCEPWNEEYVQPGAGFANSDLAELKNFCTRMTDTDCARAACIVEGNFVAFISETTIRDSAPGSTDVSSLTDAYKHPTFDQAQCEVIPGPRSEKRCCGEDYPFKLPYKADFRVCCEGSQDGQTFSLGH